MRSKRSEEEVSREVSNESEPEHEEEDSNESEHGSNESEDGEHAEQYDDDYNYQYEQNGSDAGEEEASLAEPPSFLAKAAAPRNFEQSEKEAEEEEETAQEIAIPNPELSPFYHEP